MTPSKFVDAMPEATRGVRRKHALRPAQAWIRAPVGRGALMLAVGILTTACASTPTSAPSERGVRRCDRNGDYEERMACKP